MNKVPDITPYFKRKIKEGMRQCFDLATPEDIRRGMAWYQDANEIVYDIHDKFKRFNPWIVGGVIAILSPRNKWERNIQDATSVLQAIENNTQPNNVKVCTFNSNKFKAFAFATEQREITFESRKTFSFLKNIVNLDSKYITVDVWHLRACFGQTMDTGLTKNRYDAIAKITKQEAERLGILGYQYQAIIWECIRDRDELI